ncbi:hypothetical protein ACQUW5_00695 [Legionella sp. CNM-1927-20]|uniref:hypothetical protein n=1 Tax=Legionella sp. CNM-1927-20 TaxID=3422221 RepID=UPI00403A8D8C
MTDSTLFQANASINSLVPKSGNKDTRQGERGVKLAKRTVSNKIHQTLKYKAHVRF